MRLRCWRCGKSVSTEVPDETLVRATMECPECFDKTMSDIEEEERKDVKALLELIDAISIEVAKQNKFEVMQIGDYHWENVNRIKDKSKGAQ